MLREQAKPPVAPMASGIIDFHADVAGPALDRVMAACYANENASDQALSNIFGEHWIDIWAAIRESAFLVGAEYGRRLSGGAR